MALGESTGGPNLRANTLKNRKNVSVSSHPLFPAMVCLWFAAAFGLGTVAIRPALLESVVLALQIDMLVPAAAPPLGITARIILALGMFVIGAVIGLLLALRLARPKSDHITRRAARATAMRDYAERDDDGDNDDLARLDAARADQASVVIPGRRRALAMEEQYDRTHHDVAPLPVVLRHEAPEAPDAPTGAQDEVTTEVQPVAAARFDPVSSHLHGSGIHSLDPRILDLADLTMAEAGANDIADDDDDVDFTPAPVEVARLRAFDAPVTAAPIAVEAAIAEAETPGRPVEVETPPIEVQAARPVFHPAFQLPRDGAEKLLAAPLESLGVVQLAERLALAIARRRDGVAAAALATTLTPASPADAELTAEETGEETGEETVEETAANEVEVVPAPIMARFAKSEAPEPVAPLRDFGNPPPMPAALRPISFNHADDDDEALESLLPPRRFAMPISVASAPIEATEGYAEPVPTLSDDATPEAGYSSLLAVKPTRANPLWAEEPTMARQAAAAAAVVEQEASAELDKDVVAAEADADTAVLDIEPVVIFPGQAQFSASPAEPASPPSLSSAGLRRFDGPSAAPTQLRPPVATGVDPLETERALKAALATLQRMSGAA